MKRLKTTWTWLHSRDPRLAALYCFGVLMILWNIGGHAFLGFEQAYATVSAAIAASITLHFGGLWLASWTEKRPAPWAVNPERGWPRRIGDEIPAAIIPGFACAMLLQPGQRVWPVIFAVTLSFASKVFFRYPNPLPRRPNATHHMFNPSNFGILGTLVLLPSVGLAPPYQFTAEVGRAFDVILPLTIFTLGCFLHFLWSRRWIVIAAWFVGFALQGMVRSFISWSQSGAPWDTLISNLHVPLWPYTGTAFMLFSFFMIPDPATTPSGKLQQVLFGLSIAGIYGFLQHNGIVYGFWWGLIATCAIRGTWLRYRYTASSVQNTQPLPA